MSKRKRAKIIALAYFHRYGWIAITIACMMLCPNQGFYICAASCIAFSLWSFVGYKLKWRHIYCSYQNAYHKKMTPHSIRWSTIKKSDLYGVPLIFFVLGLIALVI
ncbi:MAG: hypothetical protein IKY44_06755 [Clostridia bacterium]|nr:hypothetical protein [Clostridia bacterium]